MLPSASSNPASLLKRWTAAYVPSPYTPLNPPGLYPLHHNPPCTIYTKFPVSPFFTSGHFAYVDCPKLLLKEGNFSSICNALRNP